MYKKRTLALVIASAFALQGCLETNDGGGNAGSNSSVSTAATGAVWPIFNLSPNETALPLPNDLIFQQTDEDEGTVADGTFDVTDSSPPVTTALNELSGASTIAPIEIALSGEIDPLSVVDDEGNLMPNTVHLIALDYASGNPVRGLGIGEPPTRSAEENQPAFTVSVESYDGTENNSIRITPTQPLMPNTRYLVGITTNVTDASGAPLIRSPGAFGYDLLTDQSIPLVSDALAGAERLIDFWETLLLATTGGVVTPDSVALSYSFTTSNDEKVLPYIADPAQWASDLLMGSVKFGATEAALGAGATSYDTILPTVNAAVEAWLPSSLNALLTGCDAAPAGQARFDCAASNLIPALEGGALGFVANFPTPEASTVTFDTDPEDITDINVISAVTGSLGIPVGTVSVSQGTIDLPYYLGVPASAEDGTALLTSNWVADDVLATQLSAALGSAIPQADANASTALNMNFPFPKLTTTQEAPIIAIFPTTPQGNPATGMKTVMFQHGITTDRSAALAFGAQIVAGAAANGVDVAVIAIDQPLHGIEGISDSDKADTATTLLTAAGQIDPLDGIDSAEQAAIDGTVEGTYATTVVTTTLDGAGVIDSSDEIDGTEQALIDAAFTSTLATTVVTSQLDAATLIDISDGIDAGEQSLIDDAFSGDLAANVVTSQLNAIPLIDISDGIDATEQALIDSVVAGTSGNAALAALEATAASLTTLETSATSLTELEQGAQALVILQNTVENAGSTIAGLGQGTADERHFGFTVNQSQVLMPMDFEGDRADNASGSMFINLNNFLTSRDNLRQGSLDLLTVRNSIGSMDINGGGADLDPNDVYFIGHSLGTVNGLPFVATTDMTTSTADDLAAANLLTPGGGVTRLIENSPAFGPSVIFGLAAQGFNQDTTSFQSFLNILQATLDGADSINFAKDLTTPTLFTEVIGDQTIPNDVTTVIDLVGTLDGASSIAPLSGTEPLARTAGADTSTIESVIDDSNAAPQALTQSIVRFTEGAHGTPVFPSTGTAEETAAFAEMIGQATSIILSNGAAVSVTNEDVIQSAD